MPSVSLASLAEKHYVVAIDGSRKLTRNIPFAEEALHCKNGDQITYYVYVLEAVLVGSQGSPYLSWPSSARTRRMITRKPNRTVN
jgi:hypothetical protein